MGSFDWFVGNLHCSSCGAVSPANHATGIQTKIRKQPRGDYLGRGVALHVDLLHMEDAGYLPVEYPSDENEIRLVEFWRCPRCQSANWAEIVIRNQIIESVEAVRFDRTLFERIHFVTRQVVEHLPDLVGQKVYDEEYDHDPIGFLNLYL
jgi:hypothetical protein